MSITPDFRKKDTPIEPRYVGKQEYKDKYSMLSNLMFWKKEKEPDRVQDLDYINKVVKEIAEGLVGSANIRYEKSTKKIEFGIIVWNTTRTDSEGFISVYLTPNGNSIDKIEMMRERIMVLEEFPDIDMSNPIEVVKVLEAMKAAYQSGLSK